MAETKKPQIVLVHGAWHIPEHYLPLTNLLKQAQFQVHCPRLPTCTNPTSATFTDDVSTVRSVLQHLADDGCQIILLAHSYGGVVGTEAARGFAIADRLAQNRDGGIVHLIYMCAFLIGPGETIGTASAPRPDPEPIEICNDGTTFLAVSTKDLFYHDVEPELAEKSIQMLVHQSGTVFLDKVTYAAWKEIPTTYLFCTEDKVMFPHWQQRQLDAAEQAGAHIEVMHYDSSHSPFLSMPGAMIEAVETIASRYL